MVSSIAIVAEEQFVIILRGATQGAGLTLDALPGVLFHADQHVSRELQTCWMPWKIMIEFMTQLIFSVIPERPHSEHPMSSSAVPVFLLIFPPRQKSQ